MGIQLIAGNPLAETFTIYGNKRVMVALAVFVYDVSRQFFAGSAFALYKNIGAAILHVVNLLIDCLHLEADPNQLIIFMPFFYAGPQDNIFPVKPFFLI